jgi:hypothetical protein
MHGFSFWPLKCVLAPLDLISCMSRKSLMKHWLAILAPLIRAWGLSQCWLVIIFWEDIWSKFWHFEFFLEVLGVWVWAWFFQNFKSYHLSFGLFFQIQEPLGLVQLSSKLGLSPVPCTTQSPRLGLVWKLGPKFSCMLPTFRKNSNFLLKKTWKMCSRVSFESFGSRSSKRLLVPLFGSCANSPKWPLIWGWV